MILAALCVNNLVSGRFQGLRKKSPVRHCVSNILQNLSVNKIC